MGNVSPWIRWGRVLWVVLALNAFLVVALSTWVVWQLFQEPSRRIAQGLAEHGLSPQVYAALLLGIVLVYFLIFFVVALLIFLRRPNDGFALFSAIFLLNFGAVTAFPAIAEFTRFFENPPLWYFVPSVICSMFSWTLLVAFLVTYPDGKFVPRWSLVVAIYGFLLTGTWALFPGLLEPSPTPFGVFGTVSVLGLTLVCLYAQFWRYRNYLSPVQKQQTKWFVFGVAILLVSTFANFLTLFRAEIATSAAQSLTDDLVNTLTGTLTFGVLPVTVGIAILRYRLWDIDVIIRKTLTYALVVGLLAVLYFGLVIVLQRGFASVVKDRSEVITVISTLAIAALFVPVRNKIQDLIDRRFYRKKYDAQKVLASFAVTVRDETDLESLTGRLVEVVNATMQPKSVGVWLKKEHTPERNAE
jgi:hypothetical protein